MLSNILQKIIKNKNTIQVCISTFVLFFILVNIDRKELYLVFSSLDFNWYFYSIFILGLNILVVSYKWRTVLKFQGYGYTYWYIFKLNWIAFFYNQFLPGRIGGDAIKAINLHQDRRKEGSNPSISVAIDRLYNLIGILILGLFSSIYLFEKNILIYFLTLLLLLSAIFIILILSTKLLKYATPNRNNFYYKILLVLSETKGYINSFKKNVFMIFWGIIYALLTIIMNYLLGIALGIGVSFEYYLYFLPIVYLATVIPISFGGIGIREGSYIIFLSKVGVSDERAIGLSLLSYFTHLVFSIPGFFLQFIGHVNRKCK